MVRAASGRGAVALTHAHAVAVTYAFAFAACADADAILDAYAAAGGSLVHGECLDLLGLG